MEACRLESRDYVLTSLAISSWEEAAHSLLRLDLEGFRVMCPQCGRRGLPLTKWIKGPKVKPLCVCHLTPNGALDICTVDECEAAAIRAHISLPVQDVERLVANADPYLLFSGGADSLATLAYVRHIASRTQKTVTALHVDTTVGFPEIESFVETACAQLGVDLRVVKPQVDYFALASEWGIPAFNSRWCCRELKIKPLCAFLRAAPDPKIVFDGIRAAESAVRAKYLPVWFHPGFGCLSVSPLFHWTDEEVRCYAEDQSLPQGPHLTLGTSAECWCGAYKTRSDFEALCQLNPELYDKLAEVEASNKNGFTFVYENGERISLKEIRRALETGV